ncbi:hypothetical protein [Streptomyces bobili]
MRDARQWLQGQADVRRELFARLDEAVTAQNARQARQLLARASATAAHDRTRTRTGSWVLRPTSWARRVRVQEAADAERAMEQADRRTAELTARAAAATVDRVLGDLCHRPRRNMSKVTLREVQVLVDEAAKAGRYVTASQRQEIDRWVKRAERARSTPTAPALIEGKDPVSSKPRADAGRATAEQARTIAVWVWKDRYGGLPAADTPRPEASVRHVPLPTDAGPLQRLYGNLTRMIAEREAAGGPVHTGRASLRVRVWEMDSGELAATFTRRKGSTSVTLTLPADLKALRELHAKVVAQMKAHNVARQPRTRRKNG